MNLNDIKPGLEIRTVFNLESTAGMLVTPVQLRARRPNAEGTVRSCIPQHGGNVWWVEHKDGSVAPYNLTEFHLAPSAANMTASRPVRPMKPLRFK